MIQPSKIFEVFEERQKKRTILYTRNLVPGKQVYSEDLVKEKGVEYREWDPKRSKLAAAILKGATNIGLRKGDIVLYLGAATGTTASHVSDIAGSDGFVFALDFAPRVVRQLVYVCESRPNMAPLLEDAYNPEEYISKICMADFVFQDIAQSNQAEIFLRNCRKFLKKGGFAILCVKSRSIDISKKPKAVYKDIREELEKEMTIIDYRELDPFEKDHCIFICKK